VAWQTQTRYVLAVAVIGCAYTLLQLPFAAVSIARGKKVDRFFDLASASAGLMLAAAVSMALVVMLSVYSLAK
jgi:hypothetical protein